MLRRLALATLALTLFTGSLLSVAAAANAANAAALQGHVAATTPTPSASPSNPSGPSTATPTNPAPSSGGQTTSNPATSGPANPGTGESDPQEQTRTDVTPWILAAVAAIIVIALIIWAVRGRGRNEEVRDEQL
ncbi:cobalamin biosynthesis Mg chelatase CobN [Arthrobacter sp. 1088]|uniref:membrane protein FAM174 family protein n=1 Tax=unclassified Arthrobacter TaxID=235627 RepID=UPI001CC4E207|nr:MULTISPECIES: DUF1180 domain-containing protein [unclassified Arthrobacter]MDR6686460.1 cobalamin biosynthesis Mg chelatase CobN [Arthrobacter sp. 1088]BCW50513.1 hypothetical protein StoSoilB13_28550 [Arthrobacter sp. StoSoilB13]